MFNSYSLCLKNKTNLLYEHVHCVLTCIFSFKRNPHYNMPMSNMSLDVPDECSVSVQCDIISNRKSFKSFKGGYSFVYGCAYLMSVCKLDCSYKYIVI